MAMTDQPQFDIINRLETWYWTHASQRSADKAVSIHWLDEILSLRERLLVHCEAEHKPRLGIWGPSQSGKSTLISQGVDAGAAPDGDGSALSWPSGEKVRFTGTEKTQPSTVIFNPNSATKGDASGCVTRFIATDSVPDPAHPVSIALLPRIQVISAFAAGYADEVECEDWNADSVNKFLDTLKAEPGTHSKDSLMELRELISVLEQLSLVVSRFKLFLPEKGWRLRLLDHPALKGQSKNVRSLRDHLLWDSNLTVAEQLTKIEDTRNSLKLPDGALVQISFSVAARLLDIDAAQKPQLTDELREWRLAGNKITKGSVGIPVDSKIFKYLQALVGELIVPVRRTECESAKAFSDLLIKADLVDFPGLPNTAAEGKKKKDLSELSELECLTVVFKRGKTLSLVANASRRLEMDAFLLLINGSQAGKIHRPGPLRSAIQAWANAADANFPSTLEEAEKQRVPLPMKCVTALTFFGDIVRHIYKNNNREINLVGLNQLDQVGALAKPSFVSLLPITYPSIDPGHLPEPGPVRDETQRRIRENDVFKKYFGTSEALKAYDAMFKDADGGASHLFRFLSDQISPEVRRKLAVKTQNDICYRLSELIAEHHPVVDPDAEKRATLTTFLEEIKTRAHATTPQDVGIALRDLLSVDHTLLDPLPSDLSGKRSAAYIDEQINRWKDGAAKAETSWKALGVGDTAVRARIINYFADALPKSSILKWMQENQSGVLDGFEQRAHRRFIAVQLTTGLTYGKETQSPHGASVQGNGDHIRQKIDALIRVQNDEEHQDKLMQEIWLSQWVAAVERLQRTGAPPPNKEPGDDEMRELKRKVESYA